MKKQLIILTVFLSITAVKVFCQEKNSMTTLPTVTVTSETTVNKEIDKAFKKAFPNAVLLDWFEEIKYT
jgi:hypothetical protein